MKRLLLAFLLPAGAATAQTAPTITAADLPVAGDSLRLSLAAGLPASAPALSQSGANQTWSFAGLVPASQRLATYAGISTVADLSLQVTFNNPLTMPDNRANLVAPQALPAAAGTLPVTNPYEFSNLSSADYRLVGYGATFSGITVPVTYASRAQQDVLYTFPLAYGGASVVSNSLLATPAALASSGYFSQQRQRTTQVDGWGTLTTPFGTYPVLRVVASLRDHDIVSIGATPAQEADLPLQREYKWLSPGQHLPLLTIITTTTGTQETVVSVEYRDIYRKPTTLATHSAALEAGVAAYPNPSAAGSALRLAVPPGSGPVLVTATDVVGRRLFSQRYAGGSGEVVLEAAALGERRGVLLLTVQTSQGTATRRVVRE